MKYNITQKAAGVLLILALPVLAAACASCEVSAAEEKALPDDGSIVVMTWNLQALFDGNDDGTEYDEFRESSGWSGEKYRGRINAVAAAVDAMERRPDIIALQEVESAAVLADLAAALSAGGYSRTHFAAVPGMSLGLGVISRLGLYGAKSHSVYVNGEITPRPMLEVRVSSLPDTAESETVAYRQDGGGDPVLFICHWKSKLGGDSTENTRRASAGIITRRIKEMEETEGGVPVIVMGDLNENHDEFYRRSGKIISALLPDDSRAAGAAGITAALDGKESAAEQKNDFIVISKNKPPFARFFPAGTPALYSPWGTEMENGSYYYRNNWETIDHFLLSEFLFDGGGWEFESCRVIDHPPFAAVNGRPAAYNPRTGSGLSDHLPLLLSLRFKR